LKGGEKSMKIYARRLITNYEVFHDQQKVIDEWAIDEPNSGEIIEIHKKAFQELMRELKAYQNNSKD
jgi:hypothetical protein